MDDITYRLDKEQSASRIRPMRNPGPVLYWEGETHQEAVFSCPCGDREIYLRNHRISFDDEGIMTIDPSILSEGYMRVNEDRSCVDMPFTCHLWIVKGKVKMESDSTCPGKNNA